MRPFHAVALLLALAGPGAFAAGRVYGKPLVLKQETKVSELLARPEAFEGRKVRVRGTVVEVCDERGCFVKLAGDKRFTSVMVKFEDGVVVLPVSLKGGEVLAEGVVEVLRLSVQDQKDMCPIELKALDHRIDPEKVTKPRTFVILRGTGVQAK